MVDFARRTLAPPPEQAQCSDFTRRKLTQTSSIQEDRRPIEKNGNSKDT
jgi:hypothetical protein